jgi:hypothetical protein
VSAGPAKRLAAYWDWTAGAKVPDARIVVCARGVLSDDARARMWAEYAKGTAFVADDSSAVAQRQGRQAFPITTFRIPDTMVLAGQFIRLAKESRADGFFIDETGGYGAGVIDAMRQLGHTVIGIQFSGKPNDYRYFNKRSEMYFELAAWVKSGGALPDDRQLKEELCGTTFVYQGDKFRIVEKELIKKKLGRSPDKADALALTFAYPVAKPDPMDKFRTSSQKREHDPFSILS